MKYWKHIITGKIVQANVSPDHGWLWVEVFCTGTDPVRCDDPNCPIHKGEPQ